MKNIRAKTKLFCYYVIVCNLDGIQSNPKTQIDIGGYVNGSKKDAY